MSKKCAIFLGMILVIALCFSITAMAAEYAKVDMSKVTATGEGEPDNGFTPDAIFDGDEFTRWGSMQAGESVTAVFDKEYTIEAIEIRFFRAGVREYLFKFEYSTDGNNWTEIKTTKEHSTPDESLQSGDDDVAQQEGYMETFPLVNPVTASQFRYTYEGRVDGATIGSIWEMYFVVGKAPVAVPEPVAVDPIVVEPAAVEPIVVEAPVQAVTLPAVITPSPVAISAPATSDNIALIAVILISAVFGVAFISRRRINVK